MKNKKYMSLQSELLVGTIGSMLIVALFLSVSYIFVLRNILNKSTVNSVNQTMATLDKDIFGLTVENHELVKLAYDAYLANSRSSHAKTLKRGEVSAMVRRGLTDADGQRGAGIAKMPAAPVV